MRLVVWLLVGAAGAGCGRGTTSSPSQRGPAPHALPAPPDSLAAADPSSAWRLPARVGGPLEPVAASVAAEREAAGFDEPLVLQLGPGVLARLGEHGSDAVLARKLAARLSAAEVHVSVGDDPFVRPWPLGDEARPSVQGGVDLPERPTVFVVAAGLESARWRARPATVEGSCGPLMTSLGRAQAMGLAAIEPYFVGADERLQRRYRTLVVRAWPEHEARLERAAAAAREAGQATCAEEVDELEASLTQCVDGGTCLSAPRLYLGDHLFVGSRTIGDDALGSCEARSNDPDLAGTLADLRAHAGTAAAVVINGLDPRWTEFSERLSALVAVYEHVERMCEPRRRRFTDRDAAAIETSVRSLLGRLRAPLTGADTPWRAGDRPFHVAGLGKVQPWFVADGPAARVVRSEAAALESQTYDLARCTGPFEDDPLAVVVVARGEVRSAHFVYPEQLVCPEVPNG